MRKTSPILKEKAKRAHRALAYYTGRPLNCAQDEAAIINLIADLLHFSAMAKLDTHSIIPSAERSFHNDRATELKLWD